MNKELRIIIIGGVATALLIGILVVVTGQTFGQRAAQKYPWGSDEWRAEVSRLAANAEVCHGANHQKGNDNE